MPLGKCSILYPAAAGLESQTQRRSSCPHIFLREEALSFVYNNGSYSKRFKDAFIKMVLILVLVEDGLGELQEVRRELYG